MPSPVKCFLEICEDMVQLLPLQVLFTQTPEVDNMCCGVSSGSEHLACSSLAWGLSLFKMTFSMTLLGRVIRLMVLTER